MNESRRRNAGSVRPGLVEGASSPLPRTSSSICAAEPGGGAQKPIVLAGHRARISSLAFAGDRRIGAVGEDGRFVLWERRGARWGAAEQFEWEAPLLGLAVAPAGSRAAVCGADATLVVFGLSPDAPAS